MRLILLHAPALRILVHLLLGATGKYGLLVSHKRQY